MAAGEQDPPGSRSLQSERSRTTVLSLAPTLMAVVLVSLAAAALGPSIGSRPLSDARNLVYMAVAAFLSWGLFASLTLAPTPNLTTPLQRAGYAILVVAAAGLLAAAWLGAGTAVILIIVATTFTYAGQRLTETGQFTWKALYATLTLVWIWMALAALSAFSLQGIYTLPASAAVVAAGAVVVVSSLDVRRLKSPTVAVVAVIGAEFGFALSFVRIDPFVSATLWLAGFGLAFALMSTVEVKVER